ncbi:MAG: hypothetical protein JWP97_3462, partial [Labilithrix sp.]|nr:hypothetical protein [Labilithrix sp.]
AERVTASSATASSAPVTMASVTTGRPPRAPVGGRGTSVPKPATGADAGSPTEIKAPAPDPFTPSDRK